MQINERTVRSPWGRANRAVSRLINALLRRTNNPYRPISERGTRIRFPGQSAQRHGKEIAVHLAKKGAETVAVASVFGTTLAAVDEIIKAAKGGDSSDDITKRVEEMEKRLESEGLEMGDIDWDEEMKNVKEMPNIVGKLGEAIKAIFERQQNESRQRDKLEEMRNLALLKSFERQQNESRQREIIEERRNTELQQAKEQVELLRAALENVVSNHDAVIREKEKNDHFPSTTVRTPITRQPLFRRSEGEEEEVEEEVEEEGEEVNEMKELVKFGGKEVKVAKDLMKRMKKVAEKKENMAAWEIGFWVLISLLLLLIAASICFLVVKCYKLNLIFY